MTIKLGFFSFGEIDLRSRVLKYDTVETFATKVDNMIKTYFSKITSMSSFETHVAVVPMPPHERYDGKGDREDYKKCFELLREAMHRNKELYPTLRILDVTEGLSNKKGFVDPKYYASEADRHINFDGLAPYVEKLKELFPEYDFVKKFGGMNWSVILTLPVPYF